MSPTSPPLHTPPAVFLHCHTAVSAYTDWGTNGDQQLKPAPHPTPILIIKRLEHCVTVC